MKNYLYQSVFFRLRLCYSVLKKTVVIFAMFAICTSRNFAEDANKGHSFVAADLKTNSVYRVNVNNEIEWEYKVKRPHDLWQLSNGDVLFNGGKAATIINQKKEIVWKYTTNKGNILSVQPLSNKNVLIGCYGKGKAYLLEVDRDKNIKLEIEIKIKTKKGQIRCVRKTHEGTYLIGMYKGKEIREYNNKGEVIWSLPVPWGSYLGVRLKNGNTLVACGDGHKLIEVDKDKNIIWQIDENEIPNHPLRFVAGVQRLPNGNTIICNWGGHGKMGKQAQIIEVTPDKKVVWEINDWKKFGTPAHIQILDVKGTPEKEGELLR